MALRLLHPIDDEQLVLDALPDGELRDVQRRHAPMVRNHATGQLRRRTSHRRTAGRLRRQTPCSCRRSPGSSATRTARPYAATR
jgi:hypothetical protein